MITKMNQTNLKPKKLIFLLIDIIYYIYTGIFNIMYSSSSSSGCISIGSTGGSIGGSIGGSTGSGGCIKQ